MTGIPAWAVGVQWAGVALIVLGTALIVVALRVTWSSYAEEPIVPVQRLRDGLSNLLRGRQPVQPAFVACEAVASPSAFADLITSVSADLPVTERLDAITHLLEQLQQRLIEETEVGRQARAQLVADLMSLRNEVLESEARQEQLAHEIAIGDVRLQLMGVTLIGFGTLMSTVPGLVWR